MPKSNVSVVLATCNGEKFLSEQLESLRLQSVKPAELIVSDDCSDDSTIEIVQGFMKVAPFEVQLFRNPVRKGSRLNFLEAIKRSRCGLIAFCDQDDFWLPQKIERMSEAFATGDITAAIHDVTIVDQNLRQSAIHNARTWTQNGVIHPLQVDPWFSPYGMSMVVRRELFEWVDPNGMLTYESKQMGHDRWSWLFASVLGQIVGIADPLVKYRQHQSNLFGAPVKPANSVRTFTGSSRYLELSAKAARYAESLTSVSAAAPPHIQARAARGVAYYADLAASLELRSQLYVSRRRSRFSLFGKLLRSGSYAAATKGGLGQRAMIKDAVVGLLQGRTIP